MYPAYWHGRLFKNTFTYKGRSVEVSGWSVKIQVFGKRKTFSLSSGDREEAAAEAHQVYQTILTQGWASVEQFRGRSALPIPGTTRSNIPSGPRESSLEHWKQRLIHRRYPERPDARDERDREFSVRIESAGTTCYFPLGTANETEAAERAQQIHRSVVNDGWSGANKKFPRELTLALRWLDNPLAWTYTTLHTRLSGAPPPVRSGTRNRSGELKVAVIEPDAGIREALAECANAQAGFRCDFTFDGPAEALREIPRRRVDLVLINHTLPAQQGEACLMELKRLNPGLNGVLFSVFEDSDHLFVGTPGGAVGYIFKRTPPGRIFEPIAERPGLITRNQITAGVREYFQSLSASLHFGPPCPEMAKLTAREHQVLAQLSKGAVAKEIADTLGISLWTVHGHAKNIFEKLNVHTRTEAVLKYLQK